MKLKRMLAAVLTMAMVATTLPVTAFAESAVAAIGKETYAALEEALEAASDMEGDVTIELLADVEWETGASHGSTPMIPVDATVNNVTIKGNGNTLTATGEGVGSLRAADGGTLTFDKVVFVDESVSYAESNWEFGYLEFAGILKFTDCEFNNAIQIQTEGEEVAANVTFDGCSFDSNKDSEYAVWICDGTVTFMNGCTFTGPRGAKVHEAYGSEVIEVTFDECTFEDLTKKPGLAIGTVNADTKIVITDCDFINVQPGDQNEYIYETDTDVKSFDFTVTGNEIKTEFSVNDFEVTVEEPKINVSEDTGISSADIEEAVEEAKGKIDTDALEEAAEIVVISDDKIKEELVNAGAVEEEIGLVTVTVEPKLNIEIQEFENNVLTLDIKATCDIVITGGNKTTTLENQPLSVDESDEIEIDITVPLPNGFAAPESTIYVKHTKGNNVYVYEAEVDDTGKTATFTNPHGFSPFEFYLTPMVAQVGGTTYGTLQEALNDTSGEPIKLLMDVELTEGVEVAGTAKLDLNGHSIKPAAGDDFTKGGAASNYKEDYLLAVKRGGTLTIVDGVGGGIIDGSSNNKIVCAVKMTIFGEEPTGDAATLIVDGAAIKGAPYGISGNGNRHDTSVTIIDGNISGTTLGIFQPQDGELVIKGGTITGATGVEVRDGEVKVTGGTITGTGSAYSLSGSGNGNTTSGVGLAVVTHDGRAPEATVYGGTISGVVGVVASASDSRDKNQVGAKEGEATVTLAGGEIIATSTAGADAYGVRVLDGSTVTLSGADVTSNVGNGSTKDAFGVYVRGLSNDQTTTFKVTDGSITSDTYAICGSGNLDVFDDTVIDISGGEIESKNGVAIFQPQDGVLNISGDAKITGTSGVFAKDGEVNVTGGTITGTASNTPWSFSQNGATGTGAAIVVEASTTYGTPDVSITKGTFVSEDPTVVPVQNEAAQDEEEVEEFVSGGTFSKPVAPALLTESVKSVVVNGDEHSYFTNETDAKNAAQDIADETGNSVPVYGVEDLDDETGAVKENATPVDTVKPTPAPAPSTGGGSSKPKYSASVDSSDIKNGSVKLSNTRAKAGSTITITVTPDEGYELDELVVLDKDGDKVELTDKGNGKFTFKMPKGGVEVEASFVPKNGAGVPAVKEDSTLVLTIGQVIYQHDGEYKANDVAPIIQGDRTYLPIRLIAEFMGATVTWNEAEQSVTIVKDDTNIVIYIGQAFALVNGDPVQLDAPAFIQNDRTYLPVRFIAENLGATVTWDDATKTVTIVG